MNIVSKINLVVCFVSFITLVVARFVFDAWVDILWWPLGIFLLSIVISLILDFKIYWSFLKMRVTKSGMSLGASVLILLAILSSIGYLSLFFDKTYDLTEGKIHSLSEQSLKILNAMKKDGVRILVFYKGQEGKQIKYQIEEILQIYKRSASHVQIKYIDALVENKFSQEYLSSLPNVRHQNAFVFVEYLEKKIQVSPPFDEGQILSAMVNISRRVNKNIYFISGHGEIDLFSDSAEGARAFKQALEDSSFNVEEWNFVEEKKKLPSDAAVLMILGSRRIFFEQEIEWIKEYLEGNGNLMIALDPGSSQNLTPFISESLGIDFKNNYIISPLSASFGRSELAVSGMQYDLASPITRSFKRVGSLFDGVSELDLSSKLNSEWITHKLIYSDPLSFTISSLKETVQNKRKSKSYLMAVSVQEFLTKTAKEQPKSVNEKTKKDGFSAVIFGDSDFLTNRLFHLGIHKDLALNAISYLADEDDLLSLRPRTLPETRVSLDRWDQYIFVISAILFPLLFFILAGIVWFVRKRA